MDPHARAAALDDLAATLRERLIAEPGGGEGDLHGRIRALVDREAALLDAAARDELVALVAERSFGLGPLEPLLRDPDVGEVMVNGAGPVRVGGSGRRGGCGSGAPGGSGGPGSASPPTTTSATRSSGSSRPSGAASTRPSRC